MDEFRLARIADNESRARDRNESRTSSRAGDAARPAPFELVCECGDRACEELVLASPDEYEAVRSHPARFVVLPGHEIPEAERVVASMPGFRVVEKVNAARYADGQRDPRGHVKTCRVLVVDDVVEVRILIKMLLQFDPSVTVVAEAGDGVEAIDAAREASPDIIILDLQMPRMSGWDAMPGLRTAAPAAKIVIFSSAEGHSERELHDRGAFRVIPKGGAPDVLVDAIREIASAPA